MIKETPKNIFCDSCTRVITNREHIIIKGKKRTLRYCKNGECEFVHEKIKQNNMARHLSPLEKIIVSLFGLIILIILNAYCFPFLIITIIIALFRRIQFKLLNVDVDAFSDWNNQLNSFSQSIKNRIAISTFIYILYYIISNNK